MTGRTKPLLKRQVVRLMDHVPARAAAVARTNPLLRRALGTLLRPMLPDGATAVTVRSGPARGVQVVIDPRHEKFYWAGTHEREVQDALVAALRPGAAFWDVGAHVGFYSFLARTVVGDGGRVLAVEPLPDNRSRLIRGSALNGFSNVVAEDAVVTREPGEARLHVHPQSTRGSLYEQADMPDSIAVRARTLDDLAAEYGPPEVIKIDVEGAEIDVLEGGRALLEERRPTLIVEFHRAELLAQARELLPGFDFKQVADDQWVVA